MSINDDDGKVRNACDLVARILSHPQGSIDALLRLADAQETDWLEFKASLYPEGGIFPKCHEKHDNYAKKDDFHWHVMKAVVALANSAGGAVILGLDDDINPVGLTPSDPQGILNTQGREAFNRNILEPALKCRTWSTGCEGVIQLEGILWHQVKIENAQYKGYALAVILVRPVADDKFLQICDKRERYLTPIRVPGAIGKVDYLQKHTDIQNHVQVRANQLRSNDYEHLWQRFLANLPDEADSSDLIDTAVETALIDYNAAYVKSLRDSNLRDLFTPLDLEETRTSDAGSHVGEFVPEADEWSDIFASDDPWDTHETDDEDEDEDEDEDDADNEEAILKQMIAPPRRGSVFDLLAQEPRAILLGEPGAGKSTCLQRLALERAEGYRTGAPVALYVPLCLYTKQGLTALIARRGKQPWPVIEALIRAERLHLLLDAVNECPRHLQERCCQDIKALLDAYPALPVLLTARNLNYRCQLRLPTFIVRPLERDQQRRFLTAHLHGDATRATELLDRIQNQPGGALIASNPLLLWMVVEVSRADGELPRGRALLYRRFFEGWYRREAKKEAYTGAALRWPFPRMLEALATLALSARQAGRIEMGRAWAERTLRPLLADDAVPFLERIAQGLLLRLDADLDSLSFNHESVQEYLAAEALIRQPEALADVPEEVSASWRMPLAYAFELQPKLPVSLVREAWRREPLLVAVALRDSDLLSSLPIAEDGNPWLTGILRTLRGESCEAESERIARDLLYPPVHPLPEAVADALASQAVWYAGLTHDDGIQRLERLRRLITEREEPWLDLLPLACHGNPQWKQHLNDAQLAVIAFEEGINNKDKKSIASNLNINGIYLLRRKILLGEKFLNKRRKELIQKTPPMQLLFIASASWVKEIPAEKMRTLLDSMRDCHWDWLIQSTLLIGNTIIVREKIPELKIQQWINTAEPQQISVLVRSKIINRNEIPEARRQKWIENMDVWQAQWLISNDLVRRDEIPETKRQQWIESMDVGQAGTLFCMGLLRREEIPEAKRRSWIENMDAGQAQWLMNNGLIQPKDIPETKRQQWIESMDASQAGALFSMGLLRREEIPEAKRQQWIKNMDAGQAQWFINNGLIKPKEIPEAKRQQWFNSLNADQITSLINAGFINKKEINLDEKNYMHYTKEKIQSEDQRSMIEKELKIFIWDVTIFHLNPNSPSGFAAHPAFPENVFFNKRHLTFDENIPLRIGDIFQVEIVILLNKKYNQWNFAIANGVRIKCVEREIPGWWQAWQFFAPRWEMAAEGQYLLQSELFNKLQSEGFNTQGLRNWKPTDKEGRRIKLANHLVQLALNEPPDQLPLRKEHISQQLAGDGVWADLRLLTEAYIDGKRVLSPLKKTPISKPDAFYAKPAPANRSRDHSSFKDSYVRQIQKRRLEGNRILSDFRTETKTLVPRLIDFAEFIGNSIEFTLYIDESWSGPETAIENNEGVIAGLICRGGPGQLFSDLPSIATHSYKSPLTARQAIKSLLACSKCMPFIFSIRMARQEQLAIKNYDLLLQHAIRLLCGWMIKPSIKTRLSVFCERIFQHQNGDDGTDFIHGGWSINPERFENWKLATVRWEDKEFGYIPYADLLAHLTLEHTDVNRALGAWANFKQLPGYVPFSLELVPRLERLEHLETSANLSDVIDFALETGDSPFGRLVMRDLAARLARRPDLQQRLLETLEDGYRDKVRDLRRLRRAFAAVRGLLPALPEAASPRMRLLWYLLALQDANHDGDPARIRATAGEYIKERETLKQNERELCAEADLNLAVHYADRLAFGHAEVTVGEWIYDPLFAALSLRQQGRLYSALGQYRAMQDDAQGADGFFLKALDLFGQAPLTEAERAGECGQTSIYRAINALDGSLRVVPQALEAVFGAITPTLAAQFAADGSLDKQYSHHLLLRALTLRPELGEARQAYLAARDHWQDGHSQHPWPSIHGYRGFLLWNQPDLDDEQIDEAACTAFDRAIELATLDHHGPTVKLIGALWATIAACCYADSRYETRGRALLDLARGLPDAEPAITTLEEVLAAPDDSRIGEAFAALPFNYR